MFIGIAVNTFREYQSREDFVTVTTRAREIIYTQKFEGAAVGAFNANIIARDLGLRDQKDIRINDITQMTDDELDEAIRQTESKLSFLTL